jgi:hypothetical protein
MIRYEAGPFGLNILWRLHGSAVFKSCFPALISTVIYIVLFDMTKDDDPLFLHPYPIGALIAALTFLLSYRATFAYNRYWEACSAVYKMHSRWIDVGSALSAFHLQSNKYKGRKPPSFGRYPHLRVEERERERLNEQSMDKLEEQLLDTDKTLADSLRTRIDKTFRRGKEKRRKSSGALYPKMMVPATTEAALSSPMESGMAITTAHKIETRKHGVDFDLMHDEPALFCKSHGSS